MTILESMARQLASLRYEDLPPSAVEAAKVRLLDSVGCALGALGIDPAPLVIQHVADLGGKPECTVIGAGLRTNCPGAAFANSALIRLLDANDIFFGRAMGGHPSDFLSGPLAMAERQHADGKTLITAVVISYEVACRFSEAQKPESKNRAWDYATLAGFAGAASAAYVLGLDAARLAQAMALGGNHAGSFSELRRGEVPSCKATASAAVLQWAVQAALLAGAGLTGPLTLIEGSHGFIRGVGGEWDEADRLTGPLQDFYVEKMQTKFVPAIGTSQSTLAAVLQLREAHGVRADQVEAVLVELADIPLTHEQQTDPARLSPTTRETADHSLPYLVAVALMDGEITQRQFTDNRWLKPATRALMARVQYRGAPDLNVYCPGSYPARVTIRTAGGASHTAEVPYPPGHPGNPMDRHQTAEKFRRLAREALPAARLEAAIGQLLDLERVDDVAKLMALLG